MHGCMCAKNAVACFPLSLSLSVCKTSTHPPTTAKIYCRERMIITRARIQLFAQSFTLLSHLLAARVTTTKPPLMAQMTSTHMAAGVRWLYVCLRTNTHTVVWRHPHTCDVRPLVTFSHTRTTSGESAQKKNNKNTQRRFYQTNVCVFWGCVRVSSTWVPEATHHTRCVCVCVCVWAPLASGSELGTKLAESGCVWEGGRGEGRRTIPKTKKSRCAVRRWVVEVERGVSLTDFDGSVAAACRPERIPECAWSLPKMQTNFRKVVHFCGLLWVERFLGRGGRKEFKYGTKKKNNIVWKGRVKREQVYPLNGKKGYLDTPDGSHRDHKRVFSFILRSPPLQNRNIKHSFTG